MVRGAVAIADRQPFDLLTVRNCNLFDMAISPGYTVSDWLRDGDRDLRKVFYKITTKIGLGEHVDAAVKDRFYTSEFLVEAGESQSREIEARGLGLAYLLDGVAVSLASEERWRRCVVIISHQWLDEEEQEHSDEVEVVNVSKRSNVEAAADRLYQQWQSAMSGQRSAVSRCRSVAGVFPHLALGKDVESQFQKLATDVQRVILRKFIEFDGAVREWRRVDAPFPKLPGVRPDGKATMDRYGENRTHRDRCGEEAVYNRHVSAGRCRIHFRVESGRKVVEVGYVGKHLPTKKYH